MSYDPSNPPDWFTREAARFDSGEYERPSWPDSFLCQPGHFVHLSKKQPGMVAYTPSARHGESDRQVALKPGKYITKYFPDTPQPEVAKLAGLVSATAKPSTLHIARTREEIAHVYINGPESCMNGKFHELNAHPSEVYAGPDTAVAYLKDTDDRIVARAVIRTTEPVGHLRMYGDTERLSVSLDAEGYGEPVSFAGCRLLHIEQDNRHLICAWMDGGNSKDARYSPYTAHSNGRYLTLDDDGDLKLRFINGLVPLHNSVCCCCDEPYDEDELYDEYCPSCLEDTHVQANNGDWIREDAAVEVITRNGDTDWVHQYNLESYQECALSERMVHRDLMVEIDGEWYQISELEGHDEYQVCVATSRWYHVDNMVQHEGEWFHKDADPCLSLPRTQIFPSHSGAVRAVEGLNCDQFTSRSLGNGAWEVTFC